MTSDAEIKSLTGLRGFAALYVVAFHFFIGQHFTNPLTTLLAHGYLAVDIFFVLSGFVMTLTYARIFKCGYSLRSNLQFLAKRIARVYPLYLVGSLCAFFLIRDGLLEPPHLSLKLALLWNLLMVQSWGITQSLDGPGWSISTEWAAYLLFPVFLLLLVERRIGRWLAAFLSLGTLVFLIFFPLSHAHAVSPAALLDIHDSQYALPVLRCLSEFILGMLAYKASTMPLGARFARLSWLNTLSAIAILVFLMRPDTDLIVVCLIPPLLVGLACGHSAAARMLSAKPFETAGRYSYSIYLIHTLLYGLMGRIHHKVNTLGLHHGQTAAALIGFALTVPLAALAYQLIERPGRTFLRNLFETPKASVHARPNAAVSSLQLDASRSMPQLLPEQGPQDGSL